MASAALNDEGAASALNAATLKDAFSELQAGCKVACPVCGKRVMFQSYQTLFGSGAGQHIRAAHPEYFEVFERASRERARVEKAAEKAAAVEAKARPLRTFTVTGAFLDEIASKISSLIGMMEPYYSQGNAADDAYALTRLLEAMQDEAAAKATAA